MEDGDGSSGESEAPIMKKLLPQRQTRGRRMGKLVGEAAEADAQFWEQGAFQEDESDEEFEESEDGSSASSSTATDSDIDAPEQEEEEGAGAGGKGGGSGGSKRAREEVEGDEKKKGGRAYLDPALRASSSWGGSMGSIAAAAAAATAAAKARATRAAAAASKRTRSGEDGGGDASSVDEGTSRSLRASTQSRSGDSKAASSAASAAAAAASAASGAGTAQAVPKPTQAEVLTEAAHTAIENLRLLEGQIKIDKARSEREAAEAAAGRGKGHILPASLPTLRFLSRRGAADTITFTNVDEVPRPGVSGEAAPAKPPPRTCVISGRPAKYFDPLTGQPYATVDAFRALRARHAQLVAAAAAAASGAPSPAVAPAQAL
jgi:hypothetical protein